MRDRCSVLCQYMVEASRCGIYMKSKCSSFDDWMGRRLSISELRLGWWGDQRMAEEARSIFSELLIIQEYVSLLQHVGLDEMKNVLMQR